MKFKNMKIAITDEAHLKAVCDVLESMGYIKCGWIGYTKPVLLTTTINGHFTDHAVSFINCFVETDTTLTDLLSMRDQLFM